MTKSWVRTFTGHDFYMEGKEGSCISATKSRQSSNDANQLITIIIGRLPV